MANGEHWVRRHLLQLLVTAVLVVGAWYTLQGRVQALEDDKKEHKEEIKEIKVDVKDLNVKVGSINTSQAVMQLDINHIKEAIDEIKRAVVRPQ